MRSLVVRAWRRAGRPVRPDSGFSLIEAVVALALATTMFLALATAAIFAIRTSMVGRHSQQAADFMTRALEDARLLGFGSLGNDAADIASDSRVNGCACLDPGTGSTEPLHLIDGAGVNPHILTPRLADEANHTPYTVATYVTEPAGMDASEVLRVTVIATWKDGTEAKTRKTSSLVTFAQRGLPLPTFKLDAITPLDPGAKSPGSRFAYGFKLVNQGAPDRWNITLSGSGSSLPWKLYKDADNNDDSFDLASDTTQLSDSTADGIPDTGRLEPSGSFVFWLVYEDPSGGSDFSNSTTITATSVGQPTASGAAKSQTVTTTVSSTGSTPSPAPSTTPTTAPATDCTWSGTVPTLGVPSTSGKGNAYTTTTYTLHNGLSGAAVGGSTTSQAVSRMNAPVSAYESTLRPYSTDQNSNPGRTLQVLSSSEASAPLSLTDPRKYADWQTTAFGNNAEVAGSNALLKLWVGGVGGSLNGASLRVSVYSLTSSTKTLLNQVDFSSSISCSGFAQIYVPVTVAAASVKNAQLGVRVVNTGPTEVRVAYDVAGAYEATFGIGVR